MRIKPFFPVFVVLVGVVVYAYYAPEKPPERGITVTPKQYMEMVQKNRAAQSREPEMDKQEQDRPKSGIRE